MILDFKHTNASFDTHASLRHRVAILAKHHYPVLQISVPYDFTEGGVEVIYNKCTFIDTLDFQAK